MTDFLLFWIKQIKKTLVISTLGIENKTGKVPKSEIQKVENIRTNSLDVLIDKNSGKIGTEKRDAFEYELQLDINGGETIKNIEKKEI